jgi:hypothetical protein
VSAELAAPEPCKTATSKVDPDSPAVMALPLRMAVAHAQFEAIHPYGAGNGRVGRLLPPLTMAAEGLPPLYLPGYLPVARRGN